MSRGGGLPQRTPKKKRGERNQAVDLDSRAGAGAATTAANDAGAGASAATGENFGADGLGAAGRGAAAVPSFRPPRAFAPPPRVDGWVSTWPSWVFLLTRALGPRDWFYR